ncbi:MAG: 6-carboxytetrahydropterin synthase QueD [Thermodesulfobacteriota bacterium]|nr:6-carboxytetrahydropterin synthase QueD [Thermodesulfobacteriota bacterium]
MNESSQKGKYRLAVRDEFSASHQLRHFKGKCENLHGHNFGVKAVVEGQTLTPDTEILIDFGELKSHLKEVLASLDHKHLNDLEYFKDRNPSSENLARFVFQGLQKRLSEKNIRMVSVTVSEKAGSSATYFEE